MIPSNCDERCINSTIINRAYYSAYSLCALWLEDVKKFRITRLVDFSENEKTISEHKQVRNALFNFGEKIVELELYNLAKLRNKADYDLFTDLTSKDVSDAIHHMENIFNHLKFE